MRHSLFIASLGFICATLGLVLSASANQSKEINARCLLEIDGNKVMNGNCHYEISDDLDGFDDLKLKVECPGGDDDCFGYQMLVTRKGVFGVLNRRVPDSASLCWNRWSRKASECLHGLKKKGACWQSSSAKSGVSTSHRVRFCAWAL